MTLRARAARLNKVTTGCSNKRESPPGKPGHHFEFDTDIVALGKFGNAFRVRVITTLSLSPAGISRVGLVLRRLLLHPVLNHPGIQPIAKQLHADG